MSTRSGLNTDYDVVAEERKAMLERRNYERAVDRTWKNYLAHVARKSTLRSTCRAIEQSSNRVVEQSSTVQSYPN